MSKESEALTKLHMMALPVDYNERQTDLCDLHFETINKALKRNEPMKVIVDESTPEWRKCPNCKNLLFKKTTYCPDCGQRLDWSDEK